MPESAPLRQRQDAALTPTNRSAPVGVIRLPTPPRLRTAVRSSRRPRSRPSLVRLSKRSAAASGRAFREPSCFRPRPPSPAADRWSLRPRRTSDAHVRLLGDGAESLPCRPKPIPFLPEALSAINRHLGTPERGPSRHPRNPTSSQTTNGAPLDLLCFSSTSPVNPGLPSSAILAPVEPASEEAKRSRMPLSDWRPSASAAPIAPRSPRSTRRPRNRPPLATIAPPP